MLLRLDSHVTLWGEKPHGMSLPNSTCRAIMEELAFSHGGSIYTTEMGQLSKSALLCWLLQRAGCKPAPAAEKGQLETSPWSSEHRPLQSMAVLLKMMGVTLRSVRARTPASTPPARLALLSCGSPEHLSQDAQIYAERLCPSQDSPTHTGPCLCEGSRHVWSDKPRQVPSRVAARLAGRRWR